MNEMVSKIGSLFTHATADALFDETNIVGSETLDKVIKSIKSVLDKAHTGATAYAKAKPLHDTVSDYCREKAIMTLQKKIVEYEKLINKLTPLTGRSVIYLPNPYGSKTDEEIKADIKFTIIIVYLDVAKDEGSKTLMTEIIKRFIRFLKKDSSSASEDSICQQILKNPALKP